MDDSPLSTCNESVRSICSGGSKKGSAPGCQIIEREGWCSSNDAVKLLGKVLCSLEALTTASRAAEVVGLVVRSSVESFGDLLTNNRASVKSAMLVFIV